jgi:hypothetical protein
MQTVMEPQTPTEPSVDILKLRYQELSINFRQAVDHYLKATAITFAILGVSIGYLLQAHLDAKYIRLMCVCALVAFVCWYICNYWTLRLYRSLANEIKYTAQRLGLKSDEESCKVFKVLIWCAMVALSPVALLVVYFLISPPKF